MIEKCEHIDYVWSEIKSIGFIDQNMSFVASKTCVLTCAIIGSDLYDYQSIFIIGRVLNSIHGRHGVNVE
jgi:hypothetical protein